MLRDFQLMKRERGLEFLVVVNAPAPQLGTVSLPHLIHFFLFIK
jgi:hypothetical protein